MAEPDISGTQLVTTGVMPALVRIPAPIVTNAPHPVLVMMHGWGANESDIFELVEFIDRRVLIVAPRGVKPVNDDPRGAYSWYDRTENASGEILRGTLEESLEKLGMLVDQLEQYGGVEVDPAQIYVGGFSQGGAMSLEMAAFMPEKLAGILPHSGRISDTAASRLREGVFAGKKAFVAHGEHDMVLQIKNGIEINETLLAGKVDVTYREYPIGHETSPTSRHDLANWLFMRLVFPESLT